MSKRKREPVAQNCKICCSDKTCLITDKHPGYIVDTFFRILKCNKCDTLFVDTSELNERDLSNYYKRIYKIHPPGYKQYLELAKDIKKTTYPSKKLAKQEYAYKFILKNLPRNKDVKILEVGCGYGYLSYCISKKGYFIDSIDLSEDAINFAKKNLPGPNYQNKKLKEIKKKYDLIVSTEVIEHVLSPQDFIKDCKDILTDEGAILISTPNKDMKPKAYKWGTELPPVHLYYFSSDSMEILGQINGLHTEIQGIPFWYMPNNSNLLYELLKKQIKKEKQTHMIYEDRTKSNSKPSILNRLFVKNFFVRFALGVIAKTLGYKSGTLCVKYTHISYDNQG